MVTPAITVLMPVCNAEKFLREAIDSILNQTFRDFEFLIIDDGSTDNTVKIIQQYSDLRIRLVLNDHNLGISPTLNKGIELASCDLIARMDGDDISYPTRLSRQYEYMMSNPDCALLSTWARVISEDGTPVKLERYESRFYHYNLTFECWIYHPTVMFRRAAVKQVGMYSKPYSEDFDLFWKISRRFPIWNLEEPLLDYRLSSTSLNSVSRKREYEIANEENVVRNIQFYMGDRFTLSRPVLECLRHHFELIVEKSNISEAAKALKVLDEVTDQMIQQGNVHINSDDVRRAYFFKRQFILMELLKRLSLTNKLLLLLKIQDWNAVLRLSSYFFRSRIKRLKYTLAHLLA
jgi:glycosyltransferase involved in cell wall biosynthesis